MGTRAKTCCLTGHRDLPACETGEIEKRLVRELRTLMEKGVCFFGVGGAVGFDMLAARVLFDLRATEAPHIKIILVCPFEGHTNRWPLEQREQYEEMLPQYDKVVYLSTEASREAYFLRDRHLVDHSAYCISYCTRPTGGTAYTVQYALRQGLEVINTAEP